MASLAPASGTTQTYIWRDTDMMAKKAGTLPISVELMSQHSVKGGQYLPDNLDRSANIGNL